MRKTQRHLRIHETRVLLLQSDNLAEDKVGCCLGLNEESTTCLFAAPMSTEGLVFNLSHVGRVNDRGTCALESVSRKVDYQCVISNDVLTNFGNSVFDLR